MLRDELLVHGVCFPSIWSAGPDVPAHTRLVRAIRTGDLTPVRRELKEILARKFRYVVISCEGLSALHPEQIVQLRQLVGDTPLHVVHYVRRWPERLASAWQEQVRQGHTTTLPEFIVRQQMGYDGFARQDLAILDRFRSVFGADQIKIVSYSYLTDNGMDIARHFLASFLDLPGVEPPDIGHPNRSLSTLDTEIIRVLNAMRTSGADEWSTVIQNWYLPRKEALVPASVLEAMSASIDSVRLDETVPPLSHAWRDVLARYATSLVPPWDADTLHEPRAIDAPFVRQDYLLEPAVPNQLREIYRLYLGMAQGAS